MKNGFNGGCNLRPPFHIINPVFSEKYPVRIDLNFKALKNRVSKSFP
jgi:hypothetical protein